MQKDGNFKEKVKIQNYMIKHAKLSWEGKIVTEKHRHNPLD